MAAIKASVNVFALLDGDDPGDKRLADLDPRNKDEPKKKPLSAAACDYKLKLMKPPSPAAVGSKAPRKQNPTPAVAAGLRSAAAKALNKKTTTPSTNYTDLRSMAAPPKARPTMNKQTTTPVAPPRSTNYTDLRSMAAAPPKARATMNKQTTTPAPPPARSTNLTGVLFTYPSARERIFKQRQERQEEFERQQAKAAENGGGDDGKSAAGVKVKKEAPAAASAPVPAEEPVVLKTCPLPPPRLEDVDQFPSLK